MIGIEVNGEFLLLEQNVSVRFEKNFPILFQDLYQGDYSFPFTLNAEANYKILGFANIPEASNKILKYDCSVYLFGLPFTKAILLITRCTKYTFQVNLVAGIKTLKTASKLLTEINYGDPTYLGELSSEIADKATVISKDLDYTHFGFTFVPHINDDFYGGNNPDWKNVLNMVDPNTGGVYYNTNVTGNKYALVPWFYLHFILQKIFDEEGLTPTGTFWNNAEMKKLLVYNNKSLDSLNEIGDTKVESIVDQIYNRYDSVLISNNYELKVNFIKGPPNTYDIPYAFNNTSGEYTITQIGLYTFKFNLNVYYRASYFVYRLYVNNVFITHCVVTPYYNGVYTKAVFNLTYNAGISDLGKKAVLKVVVGGIPLSGSYDLMRVLKGSTMEVDQSNPNNLNLYSKNVFPVKHMKAMTVEEFLLSIKQLGVELSFNYTNNTVNLDFLTDKINNSVAVDWSNKAVDDYELDMDNYNKGYMVGYNFGDMDKLNANNFKPIDLSSAIEELMTLSDLPTISSAGKIAYVKNLNQYYISAYDQYASPQYYWQKHTDYYFTKKYAGGETEAKLGFSPMLMGMGKNIAPSPNLTLETALMPISKNQGSSEMFDIGDTDFDLKFCFLRGQNIVGGAPNNKGGNYVFASSTKFGLNGHTIGDFDFTQQLDSGFFKRFIDWIYERIANGQVIDQDFRLTELDILTLGLITNVSVDGINYLLKTVSISGANTLKLSRAKMLKI